MAEVPMTANQLPEIDILLISHDHYDHLDYQTIRDIDVKVKNYCVPLGVENHLERCGVDPQKIHTFAWWEDMEIDGLAISSTPGQHYSGRLPWGITKLYGVDISCRMNITKYIIQGIPDMGSFLRKSGRVTANRNWYSQRTGSTIRNGHTSGML